MPFHDQPEQVPFLTPAWQEALRLLNQTAALRSVMLLSGDNGVGKSALAAYWLKQLEPKLLVITQATLTATGPLAVLLHNSRSVTEFAACVVFTSRFFPLRRRLGREGWTLSPGAIGRPSELVEAHPAHFHGWVPGVIDQVLRTAVRARHDGMMARPADLVCNAMQHPGVVALVGVRPEQVAGQDVIHAITCCLVVRAAVETVVAPVVLDYTWPFYSG